MSNNEGPYQVYIVGRGYSGSTLLNILLGNAERAVAVGELADGLAKPNKNCSCGARISDCAFWSEVAQRHESRFGSWADDVARVTGQARLSRYPRTLLSATTSPGIRLAVDASRRIAASIAGCEHGHVIDSSKQVSRGLLLLRADDRAFVIHLVRHPEAVLESQYRRLREGKGFRFFRRWYQPKRFGVPLAIVAISWAVGNILVELSNKFSSRKALLVRYEDLVADAAGELAKIGRYARLDLREVVDRIGKGEEIPIDHIIAGNAIRMAGSISMRSETPIRSLPRTYRILARLVCGRVASKYGYGFNDDRLRKPAT